MMNKTKEDKLLEVSSLRVIFPAKCKGQVKAVDGIDLTIAPGEIHGLVVNLVAVKLLQPFRF